jgi:sulfur-carrier protein adenylyltransferase/sulfurtransferase
MLSNELNKEEIRRYSRHIILPEINIEGQQKLKGARVLVVGAGGLGCPVLQYLAAAGIGTIGIVDNDVVDESNLQRQVLYTIDDIGKPKVEIARNRIKALNPYVNVECHKLFLGSENALDILKGYDIIVDGSDNFATRYLVNDACMILGKPNVYGAIFRFEGQVSVFNHKGADGDFGPNYRDLFPVPSPPDAVPGCAEGGVLGVLPGTIGCVQANEVIKMVTGIGQPLAGRLLLFDALEMSFMTMKIGKDPDRKEVTALIDYQAFCQMAHNVGESHEKKEISVDELYQMQENNEVFQLIDVREPYEHDIVEIGGELIPLRSLEDNLNRISKEQKVVVYCRTGLRSSQAVEKLKKLGYEKVYPLKGGILAWINEIDPDLPRY